MEKNSLEIGDVRARHFMRMAKEEWGYSHTVAGFFLKNYDHPIVEEGKVLKDMIYFKRKI